MGAIEVWMWRSQHWIIAVVWLAFTSQSLADAYMYNGFYHLASDKPACQLVSPENETVDVVCHFSDYGSDVTKCRHKQIEWRRMAVNSEINITDSKKYGVWNAIPGWGMGEDTHVSFLRIRVLQAEDVGTYRCEIYCDNQDSRPAKRSKLVNVCLQQKNINSVICGHHLENKRSVGSFWNRLCDSEFDQEEALYDGFDCADETDQCDPIADERCRQRFGNGECDRQCNSEACAWDGGDCVDKPLNFAEDTLILYLARWYQLSSRYLNDKKLKKLGRALSYLLRTIVRILPDDWYRNRAQDIHLTTDKVNIHNVAYMDGDATQPDKDRYSSRMLYIKLDNTNCVDRCFTKAESAAKFISLALRDGWDPGIKISAVGVMSDRTEKCALENNTMLHIKLSGLDGAKAVYSQTYSKEGEKSPDKWIVVAAVLGGLCCLILLAAIIIVVHRLKHVNKNAQHQSDVARIHADKKTVQGTDV